MQKQWLLLSVLLAMSLVGCANSGKKNTEGQRNAVAAENGYGKEEHAERKRLLEMAKLTQKFEKIFREFHQTETKDLEGARELEDFGKGSYTAYKQWVDENDVLHVEIHGLSRKSDNHYRYASEIHPDGTKIISCNSYDLDSADDADNNDEQDRKPDKRIEERFGNQVLLQSYLIDSNSDGIFDERISNTFDFENNKSHRLFEKLKPDGSWEKILEKTEFQETPFPPKMKVVPKSKESFQAIICAHF